MNDHRVVFDFEIEFLAERVHAGDAYAVQSAGNLVSGGVEFSSSMQLGHDDLRRGDALIFVDIDRNTATVIDYRDRIVVVNDYVNFRGKTRHRFIYGIIDDFIYEMVQTRITGGSDIHGRAQPYCFEAFKDLDAAGIVTLFLTALTGSDFIWHKYLSKTSSPQRHRDAEKT